MDRLISQQEVLDVIASWFESVEQQRILQGRIKAIPSADGEYISRQDAIKAIDEKAKRIKNEDTLNGLAGAVGILFDLPPVNPQPKTGHWIDCDDSDDYCADGYDCSVCGVNAEYSTSYCPNCGAKMVEPQKGANE